MKTILADKWTFLGSRFSMFRFVDTEYMSELLSVSECKYVLDGRVYFLKHDENGQPSISSSYSDPHPVSFDDLLKAPHRKQVNSN